MTTLALQRDKLHADVERLMATAETAEKDGDAMRTAILETLEIHAAAVTKAETQAGWYKLPEDRKAERARVMADAAEDMADRLQQLSRVHVSTEEIELPTDLGLDL